MELFSWNQNWKHQNRTEFQYFHGFFEVFFSWNQSWKHPNSTELQCFHGFFEEFFSWNQSWKNENSIWTSVFSQIFRGIFHFFKTPITWNQSWKHQNIPNFYHYYEFFLEFSRFQNNQTLNFSREIIVDLNKILLNLSIFTDFPQFF